MIDGKWKCCGFIDTCHITTQRPEQTFSSRCVLVRFKSLIFETVTGSIIQSDRNLECCYEHFLFVLYVDIYTILEG